MWWHIAVDPHAEPDVLLRAGVLHAPRLARTPRWLGCAVRLHFDSRGAIANLRIEPLPPLPNAPPSALHAELRVHAVGLNFRDVLNVLGEYPGDPGPPGGDSAGTVTRCGEAVAASVAVGDAAVGLAHAPLVSVARADARLLVHTPRALSAEARSRSMRSHSGSMRPITCSTDSLDHSGTSPPNRSGALAPSRSSTRTHEKARYERAPTFRQPAGGLGGSSLVE